MMPRINSGAKASPPLNLPQLDKTEDIFERTDKTPNLPEVSPTRLTPVPTGPSEPLTELPDDLEAEGGGHKKFFFIGLAAVIVILVGAGYFAYSKFFKAVPSSLPELNLNEQPALNQNINQPVSQNLNASVNLNVNANQNVNVPTEPPANANTNRRANLDSDKDGLTDGEEETYGTDAFEPDSDGDGLYDREEVKVYHTNPLNPDTDADGYLDGDEVEHGYNPLGPGKLLDINL